MLPTPTTTFDSRTALEIEMKLGATETYPNGMLGPHDEGGIQIGIAVDSKGTLIINFGKEVSWIGMPKENAVDFARLILKNADVKKVEIEL